MNDIRNSNSERLVDILNSYIEEAKDINIMINELKEMIKSMNKKNEEVKQNMKDFRKMKYDDSKKPKYIPFKNIIDAYNAIFKFKELIARLRRDEAELRIRYHNEIGRVEEQKIINELSQEISKGDKSLDEAYKLISLEG